MLLQQFASTICSRQHRPYTGENSSGLVRRAFLTAAPTVLNNLLAGYNPLSLVCYSLLALFGASFFKTSVQSTGTPDA